MPGYKCISCHMSLARRCASSSFLRSLLNPLQFCDPNSAALARELIIKTSIIIFTLAFLSLFLSFHLGNHLTMEDEAPLPLSLRGGGVKQLSKKLRPSSETPDVFSTSLLLHGKRIGIDLSVILHKSLGTEDGAGEFFLVPTYPNNEVIERCTRLCSYAKTNAMGTDWRGIPRNIPSDRSKQ